MTTRTNQPPWEFLFSASSFTLQSFELSRLNHAANLRKEIARLLDQWMEENASALLARWLLEQRQRPVHPAARAPEPIGGLKSPSAEPARASDNFFAGNGAPGGPP